MACKINEALAGTQWPKRGILRTVFLQTLGFKGSNRQLQKKKHNGRNQAFTRFDLVDE
jgi:hypothetical protein